MAGKGKGKAFYKNKYTHQELWTMLQQGNDYEVERAGSIWTSAASGMKAAREELDSHVSSLRTQWSGPASDEFDSRMSVIKRYSVESENGMRTVGETVVPNLAAALKTAQESAVELNPSYLEDDFETWVLSKKNVEPGDPRLETNRAQWTQEWNNELDLKHDQLAEIIANLGDTYAQALHETFAEPPPPPPSDLPGNATYQPPTGGVFAEGGLNPSGSTSGAAPAGGGTGGAALDTNGDGVIDSDDLDPDDSGWNPGSYDDIDSDLSGGGLASATMVPTGGGPSFGGGPSLGGSSITSAAGAGLFPAAASTTSGSNAPGRGGTTNNSPARAGATSNRPGSTTGARSGGTASSGRGTGSGNQGRMGSNSPGGRNALNRGGSSGTGGRGGTRSGYADDDEETYTRETWLREDDVDWGQNNVRREELDDDDDY